MTTEKLILEKKKKSSTRKKKNNYQLCQNVYMYCGVRYGTYLNTILYNLKR